MEDPGSFHPGISVIVPVYNSEGSLPELRRRLALVLPELAPAFEIILVDDGSRDGSWSVVCSLAAQFPDVRGFRMMRNYGQHNALLCGLRHARFDTFVTIDDDLQNPPEEIPRMLERLGDGFDVVYGTPAQEQHGLWRDLASRITKLALKAAMGVDVARQVSAFRCGRTIVRRAFDDFRGPLVTLDVLLTWGTLKFSAVTVRQDARTIGASNYTFGKLVIHALNMTTGFSVLPLQIASMLGFAFTLFGFVLFVFVIARYLMQGVQVPGFAFLASLTSILSGVQLFALGVIGEYLARMHLRMMDRPTYALRDGVQSRPPGPREAG